MLLQMDDGDLAPELGYWGVPSLGVYAYTHWEWGQFFRALTQAPRSLQFFLSKLLSFSVVAVALSKPSRWLWVGSCCMRRCVFWSPWSGLCIFSGHPSPHLPPSPSFPSDWMSFVTPREFSSSCYFPQQVNGINARRFWSCLCLKYFRF